MAKTKVKTFEVKSNIVETTHEINNWTKDNKLIIHQVMPIVEKNKQHIMVVYSKKQICNF